MTRSVLTFLAVLRGRYQRLTLRLRLPLPGEDSGRSGQPQGGTCDYLGSDASCRAPRAGQAPSFSLSHFYRLYLKFQHEVIFLSLNHVSDVCLACEKLSVFNAYSWADPRFLLSAHSGPEHSLLDGGPAPAQLLPVLSPRSRTPWLVTRPLSQSSVPPTLGDVTCSSLMTVPAAETPFSRGSQAIGQCEAREDPRAPPPTGCSPWRSRSVRSQQAQSLSASTHTRLLSLLPRLQPVSQARPRIMTLGQSSKLYTVTFRVTSSSL